VHYRGPAAKWLIFPFLQTNSISQMWTTVGDGEINSVFTVT